MGTPGVLGGTVKGGVLAANTVATAAAVVGYLHGPFPVAGTRLLVVALGAMAVFHGGWMYIEDDQNATAIPVVVAMYAALIWGMESGNPALGRNLAIGLFVLAFLVSVVSSALSEARSQVAD